MGQTEIKLNCDRLKPTRLMITLNENGLKTSIKRQIVWLDEKARRNNMPPEKKNAL